MEGANGVSTDVDDELEPEDFPDDDDLVDEAGPSATPEASFSMTVDLQAVSQFRSDVDRRGIPYWRSGNQFVKGQEFAEKKTLVMAVKEYHLQKNVDFIVRENTRNIYALKCREEGCSFYFRAALLKDAIEWRIRKFTPHSCSPALNENNDRFLTYQFIAEAMIPRVKENPALQVKTVIQLIRSEYRRKISYKKAWLGRAEAIRKVYGDWVQSYAELPRYILTIRHFMPNSIVDLDSSVVFEDQTQTNTVRQFKRCFWAFGPCVTAFKYMKPLLQIDATHLYGKYKGKLLVAVAQDGNNKIIPMAFGLVAGESRDDWKYFLDRIRNKIIGPRTDVAVITDRAGAIMSIMREEWYWRPPYAQHFLCLRHIASNFQTRFGNKEWKKYLINTGYYFRKDVVETRLEHLKSLHPSVASFFDELPLEKWSQLLMMVRGGATRQLTWSNA